MVRSQPRSRRSLEVEATGAALGPPPGGFVTEPRACRHETVAKQIQSRISARSLTIFADDFPYLCEQPKVRSLGDHEVDPAS